MTYRQEGESYAKILAVEDLLALPSIAAAEPEVLVGGPALRNAVRWVYVSGVVRTLEFMRGGEVLITNMNGWPTGPEDLIEVTRSLRERGASGVFIDTNSRTPTVHPAFVSALEEYGIAMVLLHRRVDSVRATEEAHRRILVGQSQALKARDEIHQLLTTAVLRGASAEYLVGHLGLILQSAVVLENSSGEVIAIGGTDWGSEHLAQLNRLRRSAASGTELPKGATQVPIEARGTTWGRIIAFPGPDHPSGRLVVLEQAAIALAVERLVSGDEGEWMRESQRSLLASLIGGMYLTVGAVENRLDALGFSVESRSLYGAALIGAAAPDERRLRAAVAKYHADVLLSTHREGAWWQTDLLFSFPSATVFDERLAETLIGETFGSVRPRARLTLFVGTDASNAEQLTNSVLQASEYAESTRLRRPEPAENGVWFLGHRPLANVIPGLKRNDGVQRMAAQILTPLVEHDQKYGYELLQVIRCVVANPMNRSQAIQDSRMSRTMFYKRLRIIEEILAGENLKLDLESGEGVAALYLALQVFSAPLAE
ncbi:PucR family transcriptional regulator [Leucobacter sp. wl10]|uniref:PucR family transcriptional regulator n=1 Tax=Leucobacter sp. wl10 TaxID=2304677 RepID=UPI0013C330EF|nr:PucR family transcriptional regulator [Leucobacter sp. wl10]